MTGSEEYVTTDSFELVVGWYGDKLGGREDLVGEVVRDDTATWVYEPSGYDDGIQIYVTRLVSGSWIRATTYVK